MGPLLNSKNKVLNGFLENTFEEEAVEQIKLIKHEMATNFDEIDLVFMPSTDDLATYYPIPQPKFSYSQDFLQKNMHFTSNPGFIQLSGRENIKIDMINLDLLNYIDENKAGRASI
jgi:DNA polymerase II small subunit/DNA polymerase delta subunit B